MTGFKDEYRRRVAIKDAEEAARILGCSIANSAKRQLESDLAIEQISKRLDSLEADLKDSKAAIGELQVENETLKKHLAKRFAPIDAALVKLMPDYKPKEGNGA